MQQNPAAKLSPSWIPETIWQVDTPQSHELTIAHRPHAQNSEEEARNWASSPIVDKAILHADGRVEIILNDGTSETIGHEDITIREFTKPFSERGVPFIPDPSTPEGRARIWETFTDPRYQATEDDYKVVDINLADLAALPGAAGRMESSAYSARRETAGQA